MDGTMDFKPKTFEEVTDALKLILDGMSPDAAITEVAAVRGVRAKGVLTQHQTKQLILNGKARGMLTQSRGFLQKAGRIGCPESRRALRLVDKALRMLKDVCD